MGYGLSDHSFIVAVRWEFVKAAWCIGKLLLIGKLINGCPDVTLHRRGGMGLTPYMGAG